MRRFSFKAYDAAGALTTGEIAAPTREAALDALSRQGRLAVEVTEGTGGREPWWRREVHAFGGGRLGTAALAPFTRELATLVSAELTLDESLRIVAMQPLVGARMRALAGRLHERVREGGQLSEALAAEGEAVPPFYRRLVAAGEASSDLGGALGDLAQFLEKSAEVRGRVGAALTYPALLLVAALVSVALILTVLLPTVMPLFRDAGAEPPALLAFLARLQDLLARHWQWVIAGLAALTGGLVALSRQPGLRLWRDRVVLRWPVVGEIASGIDTARFSRTLATMLRSGVPILEALRTAGGVVSNRAMAVAAEQAGEEVKQGGMLAGPLARTGVFPDLALRLVAVGEETGQLEAMLLRVADIYEGTVERRMQRFTTLLAPLLTIAIGVGVGALMLSVMNAIISVNELAIR
jgi:general secretion pathway protein F